MGISLMETRNLPALASIVQKRVEPAVRRREGIDRGEHWKP